MTLIALIDGAGGGVHSLLAREVLQKAASERGAVLSLEIVETGTLPRIPKDAGSDTLLLVSNNHDWQSDHIKSFKGQLQRVTFEELFKNPSAIIFGGAGENGRAKNGTEKTAGSDDFRQDLNGANRSLKIVAVTSCPTGIAHTFMAAEGLTEAAKALGHEIRVETQGSVGAGTPLTAAEIAAADLVIIAADREVDRTRFAGKRVYSCPTKPAINNGQALIKKAIESAEVQKQKAVQEGESAESSETAGGVYKHLMTGVSYMLPFVVAGGLLIALSFAIGGVGVTSQEGTFANALFVIGSKGGFALMVPALAGFIAYSIADRPGIAPGMIGGLLSQNIGAGFIGGIFAGFIAGYSVRLAIKWIKLPKSLQGLMPVLVLPLIATLITGLLMMFAIGTPVAALLNFLTEWLKGLQGTNAYLLGAIIGGMMAVDMGGPVNKAAYATSVALISSGVYGPIAATMIAGMTPPMALALAAWIFPNRFTTDERSSKVSTFILGLAFISEGSIPFAARDPFRVIPALVVGSAVAGAVALGLGTGLRAPHGGIFLAFIPGVVINYIGYFAALIIGTIVTTIVLGILKQPLVAAEKKA
ncbi:MULTISPECIES: PTS fructose transporter subunit IIC [Bartonella]|uniref:PTS fructose transporter subunit IIC n=1 Tax=Bartonella TaxID=773 RepID=UPI0018DD142F|nr:MULTISPECIES: fructose-specific PTS transporter subunit EIIC [Bartonella]MBH9976045.1 PTS transporter subunit EIIC [Bartonella choladocola]MBI0015614.1 PTS transporter subunit EIIC [Bartonella sp. B10834G3]